MFSRSTRTRTALVAAAALSALSLVGCSVPPAADRLPPSVAPSSAPAAPDRSAEFTSLESQFDARLGLYAIDTGSGAEVSWRADERFAYASTVKALAAAAVLDQGGIDGLDQEITIAASDILPNSPITETRIGSTMTVGELAEAAVTRSDNAAANHLLGVLGGPQALDDALTEIGDDISEVVRTEPDLNEATPGDTRDTTTPEAFAHDLREYVLGTTLSPDERTRLIDWLVGSQTGDTLVRAELPADWTVGDKSGGGRYASRGDIAVIWPAEGDPIVIAILSSRDAQEAEYDDRLIARAASVAVDALRG